MTETNEIIPELENINKYDSADGNIPDTLGIVWLYICWNIPASDGPTDCPIRINNTVMPKEIPSPFCGDDTRITLNPPTNENDNPTDITLNAADIINSVE